MHFYEDYISEMSTGRFMFLTCLHTYQSADLNSHHMHKQAPFQMNTSQPVLSPSTTHTGLTLTCYLLFA